MDKETIIQALEGFARANEVIHAERIERLANLTAEDAWLIDQDLQDSWIRVPYSQRKIEHPDLWRKEHLLLLRSVFLQLAQEKGLI